MDMTGLVAVVTGARIKIGYLYTTRPLFLTSSSILTFSSLCSWLKQTRFNTVLKLLRNGAIVIATTRFVNNAAARYSKVTPHPVLLSLFLLSICCPLSSFFFLF